MAALGLGLDVASIAEAILGGVEAQFAAAQVALPKRRIIAPGSPDLVAWDTEMLAVTMASIGVGASPSTGGGPLRAGAPLSVSGVRHAVFAVLLTRCDPPPTNNGRTPPAAAALKTAALGLMRDAGLLSQALVNVCTDVASSGLPLGSLVEAGAVESAGPEGGYVGVIGSLAITAGRLG